MSIQQFEIQLIAATVAIACSVVGVFLVLRRMAMMSDAISHTVLLGIVVAFFITGDINSPFLILGAAITGVFTVSLVELLNKTKLVKEDAAIGIVFPALFSLAVILITTYASDVHLDSDAVLLGELAFAPFDRFYLFGVDIGPKALVTMGVIMVIDVLAIVIFYKELKIATFDAGLAATLGFMPGVLHYGLMSLVSITAVGAFDAVGSILVVALMIGPAITAYLLTDRLPAMLWLSAGIGVVSAISGYWLANILDASIAGSIATMVGVIFVLVFFLAPKRGLIAIARRRKNQKWEFAQQMLVIHLLNHEGLPGQEAECAITHMHDHMRWEVGFTENVIQRALQNKYVTVLDDCLQLTTLGRDVAVQTMNI